MKQRYEFGVMSKKWELFAEDEISAHIAMVVYIKQDIPVAIYFPESGLIDAKATLEENKGTWSPERVREAIGTIKELI